MKKEISSAPVLTYYNPKKQTVLQADASIKGLAACLLQEEKPVYYASKALTDAEWLCSHRVRNACSGFGNGEIPSYFICKSFILETDQKPLEAILLKSLNQATPRLQQILIRTFAYHLTIRYKSGITNQLADCLSCLGGQKDTIKLPSCIYIILLFS